MPAQELRYEQVGTQVRGPMGEEEGETSWRVYAGNKGRVYDGGGFSELDAAGRAREEWQALDVLDLKPDSSPAVESTRTLGPDLGLHPSSPLH